MKKTPILLILSILLSSCWSTKAPMIAFEKSVMTPEIHQKLNGRYRNYPEGTDLEHPADYANFKYRPLSRLVFDPFYNKTANTVEPYEGEIELRLLSEKELEISYFVNDRLVETKVMECTLYDNSFACNIRKRLIGFPLVYLKYESQGLQFGLSENDELVVYRNRNFG